MFINTKSFTLLFLILSNPYKNKFFIYFLKNKFKILVPIFLSRPPFVVGIPVDLANFCFAWVIPNSLFNENENPNFTCGKILNLIAKMWNDLSDDEKSKYRVLADKDSIRYKNELKIYKDNLANQIYEAKLANKMNEVEQYY